MYMADTMVYSNLFAVVFAFYMVPASFRYIIALYSAAFKSSSRFILCCMWPLSPVGLRAVTYLASVCCWTPRTVNYLIYALAFLCTPCVVLRFDAIMLAKACSLVVL